MSAILGYPRDRPQKFKKWLPKFSGNNVITAGEHLDNFWGCFQNHPLNNDDEDIVMRLFAASIVEDARKWYNSLPDKFVKTWDDFHKVFMKRWGTKSDPRMLLLKLNEIKKKMKQSKNLTQDLRTCSSKFLMALAQGMLPSFFFTQMPLMGNLDSCLGTSPQGLL